MRLFKKSFLKQAEITKAVLIELTQLVENTKSKLKSQLNSAIIVEQVKIDVANKNLVMLNDELKELDGKVGNTTKCADCVEEVK